MTNNVVSFDIGGVKGVLDTSTTIKRLVFSSTSTAAESFHTLIDYSTGSAYQVPVGKKTTIIFWNNYAPIDNGSGNGGRVIYADNANGNTNAVTLLFTNNYITTAVTNFIFIATAAPAGKYINFGRCATAGTKAVDVYAIEETA